MTQTTPHLGSLLLRRLFAGELNDDEHTPAREHAERCAECQARLRALEDERRRFQSELSFERFSAGVQRAARDVRRTDRGVALHRRAAPLAAVAALLVVGSTVALLQTQQRPTHRSKGG